MISLVQVTGATDNGGGSTFNYAFTNTPKNGSKLVLCIYDIHNTAKTMPTGWTKVTSSYGGSVGGMEVWWKDAGPEESNSYTITAGATLFISMVGYEFIGVASGSAGINQSGINSSGTTGPSETPSVLNCQAISWWGVTESGSTPTWSSLTSGWTSQATSASTNSAIASATKNVLTSDTTTAISASNTPSVGTIPYNATVLLAPATVNIYNVQVGTIAKSSITSGGGGGANATVTATLGSAPSASNVLIAAVTFYDANAAAGTLTAPAGWTLFKRTNAQPNGIAETGIAWYWITNTTSTSFNFTYAVPAADFGAITCQITEWSGVNTTTPISGLISKTATDGSTTLVSGSISSQQNQVALACFILDNWSSTKTPKNPGAPSSFSSGWTQAGDTSDLSTPDTIAYEVTNAYSIAFQSGVSVSVTYTYAANALDSTNGAFEANVILLTPAKQAVVVQTGTMVVVGNASSGSKSISPTLPSAPNSANLVIALLGSIDHSATAPPAFGLPSGWTSGYSNTFKDSGNIQYQLALEWQTGVTATSYTFTYVFNTANGSSGGDFFGVLYEVTGAPTTSPIDTDGTTSGSTTSGSAANSSTLTAGAASELPMSWALGGTGNTSSMAVSSTSPGWVNNAATAKAGAQFTDKFNASIGGSPINAGTAEANWVLTNADPYFIAIALIKALTATTYTHTSSISSATVSKRIATAAPIRSKTTPNGLTRLATVLAKKLKASPTVSAHKSTPAPTAKKTSTGSAVFSKRTPAPIRKQSTGNVAKHRPNTLAILRAVVSPSVRTRLVTITTAIKKKSSATVSNRIAAPAPIRKQSTGNVAKHLPNTLALLRAVVSPTVKTRLVTVSTAVKRISSATVSKRVATSVPTAKKASTGSATFSKRTSAVLRTFLSTVLKRHSETISTTKSVATGSAKKRIAAPQTAGRLATTGSAVKNKRVVTTPRLAVSHSTASVLRVVNVLRKHASPTVASHHASIAPAIKSAVTSHVVKRIAAVLTPRLGSAHGNGTQSWSASAYRRAVSPGVETHHETISARRTHAASSVSSHQSTPVAHRATVTGSGTHRKAVVSAIRSGLSVTITHSQRVVGAIRRISSTGIGRSATSAAVYRHTSAVVSATLAKSLRAVVTPRLGETTGHGGHSQTVGGTRRATTGNITHTLRLVLHTIHYTATSVVLHSQRSSTSHRRGVTGSVGHRAATTAALRRGASPGLALPRYAVGAKRSVSTGTVGTAHRSVGVARRVASAVGGFVRKAIGALRRIFSPGVGSSSGIHTGGVPSVLIPLTTEMNETVVDLATAMAQIVSCTTAMTTAPVLSGPVAEFVMCTTAMNMTTINLLSIVE